MIGCSCYSWHVLLSFGVFFIVSQIENWYEESGFPYITFRRDGQSIEHTIHIFDTVVSRIEAHDFTISARPTKLCRDCDMHHYCDAKNWKFRSTNI